MQDIIVGQEPSPIAFDGDGDMIELPSLSIEDSPTPHMEALNKIDSLSRECERWRIRGELIDWLIGNLSTGDAGLINGRRITAEIDRICPKE